jgi:hypothetical protein
LADRSTASAGAETAASERVKPTVVSFLYIFWVSRIAVKANGTPLYGAALLAPFNAQAVPSGVKSFKSNA